MPSLRDLVNIPIKLTDLLPRKRGGKISKKDVIKTYGSILSHLLTHVKDPKEPIDKRDYKQSIKLINKIKKLKSK
jgi:hypothetical protein